jgi:poly-gamma-glutamate synthesis protein (capsule biosynthesis protein)
MLWSAVSYLKKWRYPKITSPPEERRYFAEQRRLLGELDEAPASQVVNLALVGDLMWLRDNWDDFLAPEVLGYLNQHDIVLGNLESPISRRFRVPAQLPDYLTYNSDPRLVTSFRRPHGGNTFSALATCNNHSLDRGDAGLLDTLDFLKEQGIKQAGVRLQQSDRPFVTLRAGQFTIGFYAACWGLNNPAAASRSALHIEILPGLVPRVRHPVDTGRVREALTEMERAHVDFKIVYLHWGYEFEFYPCPDLMQVGREIIRAGADVIMGSHPHVVQPLEVVFVNDYQTPRDRLRSREVPAACRVSDGRGRPRKGLIVYSLGNFASVMFTLHCQVGMILSLELVRDQSGEIDWFRPTPRLVYNAPRYGAARIHRLVLLDEYLRQRQGEGRPHGRLREMAQWLHQFIGPMPATCPEAT